MKIGLLAYHSAINFGATLQLLSTYMYLKNRGDEPIIINWVAPDLEEWYRVTAPAEQRKMQESVRSRIWKETALCRTDQEVAAVIREENIEAVIIGSDAVCQHHSLWERTVFPCRTIIGINKNTQDREFPNPFWATWNQYLPKPIPVCVLSASNQDSQFRYFSKELRRQMAKQVNSYAYLSVRDTWTRRMFSYITRGKRVPEITPDPVFAFNHNAGELVPSKQDILERFHLPEDYILMSFINDKSVNQEWLNEFEALAQADGKVCVRFPFSHAEGFGHLGHEIHLPLSPIDWFALIKYSNGYVGNNMHPIVVSIHCGVPFFCFDNYGLKRFNGLVATDKSSKIKHILETAGLQEYRISCISKMFRAPAAREVYERLGVFDRSRSVLFANQYLNSYLDMMQTILKCCESGTEETSV